MRNLLTIACAAMLASSACAFADDYPRYDRQLERQLIERLQTRLPEMRSGYGVTQEARIQSDEMPASTNWMSRIAVDGLKKYPGRIIWL
jgi:hypothetical protein